MKKRELTREEIENDIHIINNLSIGEQEKKQYLHYYHNAWSKNYSPNYIKTIMDEQEPMSYAA